MKDDKNAFQCDAYRPLVDRIPACTAQGECLPRGCLPRGVSAWGCLPGGCLPGWCLPRGTGCLPGGCLPGGICWGMSAQGVSASGPGGCLPLVQGGVCLWSRGVSTSGLGGVSQHAMGQTPPLLWTPVKT